MKHVKFRFYEELNDFLDKRNRRKWLEYSFLVPGSVKDAVESFGVPHTEIDLILVNGNSKKFTYKLKDRDVISVYPVFESIDISNITRLRPKPLRNIKFVLDVHLGRLAKLLRLFGFDVSYRNDFNDDEIIEISIKEKRIILTRDIGILKNKKVTRGLWVRAVYPKKQLDEIIKKLNLIKQTKPFTRCLECNGKLIKVNKKEILDKLDKDTLKFYNLFYKCKNCKRIYWHGSHYEKLSEIVKKYENK
ncbi:Mut7-C RNAse domain-containing protein [bacterium]